MWNKQVGIYHDVLGWTANIKVPLNSLQQTLSNGILEDAPKTIKLNKIENLTFYTRVVTSLELSTSKSTISDPKRKKEREKVITIENIESVWRHCGSPDPGLQPQGFEIPVSHGQVCYYMFVTMKFKLCFSSVKQTTQIFRNFPSDSRTCEFVESVLCLLVNMYPYTDCFKSGPTFIKLFLSRKYCLTNFFAKQLGLVTIVC